MSFKLMSVLEEMNTQTVIKREKVKPNQKIVICKPKMNPQKSASGKTSGLGKVLALNLDNLNSIPGTPRGTRQRIQESCPLDTQFQAHTQLISKYTKSALPTPSSWTQKSQKDQLLWSNLSSLGHFFMDALTNPYRIQTPKNMLSKIPLQPNKNSSLKFVSKG